MAPQGRTVEEVIARIAGKAHGVVTRGELLDAGLSVPEIKHRLSKGGLIRVHRGVYRVGHLAPSIEATYMAAVKACGRRALLCGRSAGHLLAILRGSPPPPQVVGPTYLRVAGITTRRCRRLHAGDATRWRGIPVTTVPRTLVDLAAVLPLNALARAVHEAGIRHGTTPDQVEEVLARRPTSPGAGTLRRVLHGDVRVTLSALEARFLDRLREVGLPLPETNRPAGGRLVDCRWPEQRLTVELDGYRYHRSRHAWEQNRYREREGRARGDEFRRYTYSDVVEHPRPMLDELRALLSPGWPARPGSLP